MMQEGRDGYFLRRARSQLLCASSKTELSVSQDVSEMLNQEKTAYHGRLFFLGGRGEIRTLGTVAGTTVFKTVSLNHSDTLP